MIIWNRIEYECSHYKSKSENVLDANAFIAGLDSISYKWSGAIYRYAGQASPVQLEILSRYGISEEMLRQLGNLVNARNQDKLIGQLSQAARTIPETAAAPKGKPDASGTANAKEPSRDQPKPRGRPKGSKNKKTLEKEAQLAEENRRRVEAGLPPWNPHPGRGRISGSKNKKTIQLEADLVAENKRRAKAGLPLFDLNQYKKYLKKLGQSAKNAPTNASGQKTKSVPNSPADQPKRGGRVGGSINKKTLAQEEYDRQLSEETGVDIIGNPPPRPWDAKTRYAENTRRAKLRKMAEEIKKRVEENKGETWSPDAIFLEAALLFQARAMSRNPT